MWGGGFRNRRPTEVYESPEKRIQSLSVARWHRKDSSMAKRTRITVEKMKELLLAMPSGANIVTIETATSDFMNKGGRSGVPENPFLGKVKKFATVNCQVQSDYENAVNARRTKEGKAADFVAQAPLWGTRIGRTCVVEHKGTFYLAYRALRCFKVFYRNEKGHSVAKATIAQWFKKKSKSRQNVDDEIIWRKPKLSNIRKININRVRYEVVPS